MGRTVSVRFPHLNKLHSQLYRICARIDPVSTHRRGYQIDARHTPTSTTTLQYKTEKADLTGCQPYDAVSVVHTPLYMRQLSRHGDVEATPDLSKKTDKPTHPAARKSELKPFHYPWLSSPAHVLQYGVTTSKHCGSYSRHPLYMQCGKPEMRARSCSTVANTFHYQSCNWAVLAQVETAP